MPTLWYDANMVDDSIVKKDNYSEFSAKLDASLELLSAREKSVNLAHGLVTKLFEDSAESMSLWRTRLDSVNTMIECYNGGTEGYKMLMDLHATASKMESTFRTRAENLSSKLTEVTKTKNKVETSIREMHAAKASLESSRLDAEARSDLENTSAQLTTGQIRQINGDSALQNEIAQARLAIASAEALVEIKDTRHA